MSVVLGLKLTLVPTLIALVTLAGRRWGPAVAGALSAFPVVAAPILFFIALEQGAPFASTAAAGTLSGVLAILAFALCYAWTATRFGWPLSLLIGFVGYFFVVSGLMVWEPSPLKATIAVILSLLLAPRFFPKRVDFASTTSNRARQDDLPWRMMAGAILVLSVTYFSQRLGPQLSGVFAVFPVMSSVLTAFSHRYSGAGFAINFLRGTVLGYYAFTAFCLVLVFALPLGVALAFLTALLVALLIQAGSMALFRRSEFERADKAR